VAATAGAGALDVRSGGVEETGRLFLSVEAGAGSEPLRVRLAMTTRSFTEAIGAAVDWLWRGSAGAADLLLSPGSLRPVYCTWYSMHLDVTQAAVLRQAEAAAGLGFGTVIIDDGWQTDEVGRGYGTAGDWEPSEGKFPSPRELMDGLHAQGLRGLWWIGTPFVGDRSRLAAQHVPVLRRDDALQTSVLDVRSPASREQLERHILELVRRTGADGVKVDFLEQFARPDAPSAPADADTEDVEEAALRMLRRLRDGLADTVVDPLIEYRQPYVGPAIAGIATMLRVGDCPLSDLDNRLGVIDLRLTTRGVAVHADPIMWAPEASAGRVAQSLLNALFGVPQVSVDLVGLPTPQRKALRFWLGFWARWSDVLLTGALTAHRPDLGYPVVEASADGITIVARYAPVMVEVQGDGVQEVLIAQADGSELLVRGLSALGRVAVSIVGPTGEEVAAWTADALPEPASFAVPLGGLLSARRA
jgi:alpha-galactosidase